MRRGVVFSMDAVFALYIVLIMMGTLVVLLETYSQSNKDFYELSRIARDVYEMRHYGKSLPAGTNIREDAACSSAVTVGSATGLTYGDIASGTWYSQQSQVMLSVKKACLQ